MVQEKVTFARLAVLNEGLYHKLQDPREPLAALALLAVRERRRRIAEGRDPQGRPYKPLAPLTVMARGGGSPKPLFKRGLLMRSIGYRLEPPHRIVVGSNLKQARLLQKGGTIRPVKARLLAIPVIPQAAAAGSPRNVAGLTLIKTGKGTLLLVKTTKRAFHIWYVLLPKVTVDAREFLGAGPADARNFGNAVRTWLAEQL